MPKPSNVRPSTKKVSVKLPRTVAVAIEVPVEASEDIAECHPVMAGVAPLKSTPIWADWRVRPTISLHHAICLIHNIHTRKQTVTALKKKKDPRTKWFRNHLNTLKSAQPFEPLLQAAIPGNSTVPNDDTEIFLKNFILWMKSGERFGNIDPPVEFLELDPLYPGLAQPEAKAVTRDTGGVNIVALKNDEPPDSVSGKNMHPKRIGTMARLLLALAIKHYGYRPFSAEAVNDVERPTKGVYAPIYQLCEAMGFARPNEWETVKEVLIAAATNVGEDEVKGAVQRYTSSLEEETSQTA